MKKALYLTITIIFITFLSILSLHGIVNFFLKTYLWMIKIPFDYFILLVITDWRTFLTIVSLLLLFFILKRIKINYKILIVFLLVSIGIFIFMYIPEITKHFKYANKWNFYPSFIPNNVSTLKSNSKHIPDITVSINSHGFRDDEWRLKKEHRLGMYIGDSFVWGYGIPTQSEMVHQQLELALDKKTKENWDILNIAQSPAALWYYIHAILRIGKDVPAELYIMNFLAPTDYEPWEVQKVKFNQSPIFVKSLDVFGVSSKLMYLGSQIGHQYNKNGKIPKDIEKLYKKDLEQLVAFIENQNSILIVFEPRHAGQYLKELRHSKNILFLSWKDIPIKSGKWEDDSTLCYKNNGHPTPLANKKISQLIANKYLEFLSHRKVEYNTKKGQ